MSTTGRTVAVKNSITFVCPDCDGDLVRTTHTYDSEPVWKCGSCCQAFTWHKAGWLAVWLRK